MFFSRPYETGQIMFVNCQAIFMFLRDNQGTIPPILLALTDFVVVG